MTAITLEPSHRSRSNELTATLVACLLLCGCETATTREADAPRAEHAKHIAIRVEDSNITPHSTTPPDPSTVPSASVTQDCRQETRTGQQAFQTLFPGIRANVASKEVEFDARVSPMLISDPNTPLYYLEVICCIPDTREHETLLVTDVRPSQLHAAMLAIGLNPGKPGGWVFENGVLSPVNPTGDAVSLAFQFTDDSGTVAEIDPTEWIESTNGENTLRSDAVAPASWVFAGSRLIARRTGGAGGEERGLQAGDRESASPNNAATAAAYDADGSGQVIGLHTFGSEVIAWPLTMNPDANAETPVWIAKLRAIPPAGTPVRVRIRKLTHQ